MRAHPTSLASYLRSALNGSELVKRLLQREFTSRFKNSIFGIYWVVLTPLLTALVFTFVFSTVFQARWVASPNAGTFDFTLLLLTGLAVHGIFAEVMVRAPGLIVGNAGYVSRVVFPLELLPIVVIINALVTAGIALLLVIVGHLLLNWQINWTIVFLPLVLAPYLVVVLGLCLIVAAIGVYIRDLAQIMALLVTLSLFLTPIFYPVSSVPGWFQRAMYANPLTFIVEQARDVVLHGQVPNFTGLAIYATCAFLILAFGYWVFQRLRNGFADVI